jgi:hypothetical protein
MNLLPLFGALAVLLPAPARYDKDRLPYRTRWGAYTVTVEKTEANEEYSNTRLRILDRKGQVMREILWQVILAVEFPELTGKGIPELAVLVHNGGLRGYFTQYYFTQEEGLRNLLAFWILNGGGISAVKDLNGDGRPELIAHTDALAYFTGLLPAECPWVRRVIGWNGRRYVDQTRRYPAGSRQAARSYRADFLVALKQRGSDSESHRRVAALGYYGHALTIGEGGPARRWLLQHAPRATRRWLLQTERELRRRLDEDGSARLEASQKRRLQDPVSEETEPQPGNR